MAKFYFQEDSDICYTKDFHLVSMRENSVSEMNIFEAKQVSDTGMFWCSEFQEIGETGNCGKACESYAPCNGKNGRCRFNKVPYEKGDKMITLKNES